MADTNPLQQSLERDPLMGIADVARMCGVPYNTVRTAMVRGELRARRLGARWVTRATWAQLWIDGRDQHAEEPARSDASDGAAGR